MTSLTLEFSPRASLGGRRAASKLVSSVVHGRGGQGGDG